MTLQTTTMSARLVEERGGCCDEARDPDASGRRPHHPIRAQVTGDRAHVGPGLVVALDVQPGDERRVDARVRQRGAGRLDHHGDVVTILLPAKLSGSDAEDVDRS